jgi:hypothetical protein
MYSIIIDDWPIVRSHLQSLLSTTDPSLGA